MEGLVGLYILRGIDGRILGLAIFSMTCERQLCAETICEERLSLKGLCDCERIFSWGRSFNNRTEKLKIFALLFFKHTLTLTMNSLSSNYLQISRVCQQKYSHYLLCQKYEKVAEVFVRKYEDYLFSTAITQNSRSMAEIVRSLMK